MSGFIDRSGEIAIDAQYQNTKSFGAFNLARVCDNGNGLYGYIDLKGHFMVPAQYDQAGDFSSNGLARVRRKGFHGFITPQGDEVLSLEFEHFGEFDSCGLAWFKDENGRYGCLDASGAIKIPAQYEDSIRFAPCGLARVELGGKFGFINVRGDMKIEPHHDDTSNFVYCGLALFLSKRGNGAVLIPAMRS